MNDFYLDETNVRDYIERCKNCCARLPAEKVASYLPPGSEILELGTGPGNDLPLLEKNYRVTGSDYSPAFLEFCRKTRPQTRFLQLDARSLKTSQVFDALYSNKVLPVLKPEELPLSLKNQTRLLRPEGFVFHSFWQGEEVETLSDLSFTYYTEKALRELFAPFFHVLEIYPYNDDFFTDDSLADASLTDGSLPEETDPPANPDDDFKDSLFLIAQKK